MSGVSSDMTADGAHPIPFDPEVYCQLTIHVQAIAAAPASGKLPTLAAAAEAMVHPILERRIDLADVIDRLQNACDAYGVISAHGQDAVQAVLAKYLGSAIQPHRGYKPLYGAHGPRAELYEPLEIKLDQATGNSARPASTVSKYEMLPNELTNSRAKRVAVLVRGDQIPLKSVQWAWRHRFAFGKLALIAGDPGLGKSQIALDIGARHTTGDFWLVDGGHASRCEVLILTAEDGPSDTVAPRLVAARADMSKVHFLRGTKAPEGEEELFDLTRDVEALRGALQQYPGI